MVNPEGEPNHPREDPGEGRRDPLATARRLARQRIDDDRRRYPHDLGPVFEALAARLFEPGCTAETAVPDPAMQRRFRLAVGVTPRTYRDQQLLETAMDLLRNTTLPILEIAAGLGFDAPELFAKWFKWRVGEAPSAMRPPDGGPPEQSPAAPAADASDDQAWTYRDYRQAAAWDVSPERGAALVRKIRETYPSLNRQPHSA